MATSTVTTRGQTTIPQSIRQKMSLKEGDKIAWIVHDDGRIEIMPVTLDASEVAGLFQSWIQKTVSIEDINKAKKLVARKYQQSVL